MTTTLTIAKTFQGPPTSANGGYVCGRLASFIDGPAAVRLEAPPPLERALTIANDGPGVRLTDLGRTVAHARPTALQLEIPAPPTQDDALTASRGYRGFKRHWTPTCFAGGPAGEEAQGFRIAS
jgi:hypothetical protein